jgi:serine/threonine-protein kinase
MTNPADDLDQRARSRLGKVLHDKWRIDGLLGVGGMAVVYAATHVNNGRRVAIKLLHPELSVNPEVKTRFLREGYVANKVEHTGTVGVLDDDTAEDGSVFLVMELLEGETLEARRARAGHGLPVHEVLSLADRLLDVLAVAHDKGIVHRDIKPENIFLTREGSVKVLDFGIARMRELQGARLTMTSAGALGTPAFMPPEQARGRWEQVGPQSDIWAVGATMFTLVSGRLVHQAETVNELMLAAMTHAAPPILSVVPGMMPAVANLIDRALAYEPGARWPNARAMQGALRQAYQTMEQQHSLSGAFNLAGMQMGPRSAARAAAPTQASNPGGYPAAPVSAPMAVAPYPAAPMNLQAPGVARGAPVSMTGGGVTVVGGLPASRKSGPAPVVAIIAGMAVAVLCGVALWALVLRAPSGPAPEGTASAQGAASGAPSASAAPAASGAPSASSAPSAPSAAPAASGQPEAPAASASASAEPASTSKPSKTPKTPTKVPRRVPAGRK